MTDAVSEQLQNSCLEGTYIVLVLFLLSARLIGRCLVEVRL